MLAASIARRHGTPHAILVHDAVEAWTESMQERQRVLQRTRARLTAAERVWTVSEELRSHYGLKAAAHASVLRPIPAGRSWPRQAWQPELARSPKVVYAGKLFPQFLPELGDFIERLKAIGGRFILVGDATMTGMTEWLKEHPQIDFHPLFPSNEAALEFLHRTAATLLVFYPETAKDVHWSATSFPSKLVEYVHLDLPVLIAAGPNTAVGAWARARHWPAYAESLTAPAAIALLQRLCEPTAWETAVRACRQAAITEFSAENIQSQFVRELPRRD